MELELKLSVPRNLRTRLLKHPLLEQHADRATRKHLIAHYFDTGNFLLRRHHIGLRVRTAGDGWMQTMKAGGSQQGGLHLRHEWECPVDHPRPAIGKLISLVGPGSRWSQVLAKRSLSGQLRIMFTVEVERTIWIVNFADAQIEMVYDLGTIKCNNKSVLVSEIELELKSGSIESLYRFALELGTDIVLHPEQVNKAERGYQLCGSIGQERAATQSPLSPDLSVGQGMQAILSNCINQMRANEAGVLSGSGSEALHQMRVGLRRLRSAIRLFRQVAAFPIELSKELAWLGTELGTARDWDVLHMSTLPALRKQVGTAERLSSLEAAVQQKVREMRASAVRAIQSARYARLLLALSAWINCVQWLDGPDASKAFMLKRPFVDFANEALLRERRKMLRYGASLSGLDGQALHRLRIAVKRSRYATEFFQPLGAARHMARHIRELTVLQDDLGKAHDLLAAEHMLSELRKDYPQAATAIAFARGFWLAQLAASQKSRHKGWKKVRALPLPKIG